MFAGLHINKPRLNILLAIAIMTLFSATSFAGEGEKIAWNTILPEEDNLSVQQQRVLAGLEVTLFELESIIDKKINNSALTKDTDFTTDGDVALVYDYLMFRIYELTKLDRKIKVEFTTQEGIKIDYENTGANFFNSLDYFKRAVYVSDIKNGIKNLRESLGDLRSAMNLYTSYRIAIAVR